MPSSQGVLPWPSEGPNTVALADEGRAAAPGFLDRPRPPGPRSRVQRAGAPAFEGDLARAWRAAVAFWSSCRTAAASGRASTARPSDRVIPLRPGQLSRLLREADFTPERVSAALFVPPTGSRMMLRSANAIERIGERWFTTFAGVSIVEVSKQLYARPAIKRKESRRRVYVPVVHGAPRANARLSFSRATGAAGTGPARPSDWRACRAD